MVSYKPWSDSEKDLGSNPPWKQWAVAACPIPAPSAHCSGGPARGVECLRPEKWRPSKILLRLKLADMVRLRLGFLERYESDILGSLILFLGIGIIVFGF